jgi:hypothetical protein
VPRLLVVRVKSNEMSSTAAAWDTCSGYTKERDTEGSIQSSSQVGFDPDAAGRYEECSLIFSVLRMRMEDTGKVCCVYAVTWWR